MQKIPVISFQPKGGDALLLPLNGEKPIRYEFYRFLDQWVAQADAGEELDESLEIRAFLMPEEEFNELESFDDYGV